MSITQLSRGGLLTCILAAGLLAADNPFVGTWKLNTEKSKLATSGIGQTSVTIEAAPTGVKTTVTGVDAKGDPVNFSYEATLDGKPATITGSPQYDSVALQQVDSHHVTATGSKGGKVIYTDHRQ